MSATLEKLLEDARRRKLTAEEAEAQRVNFAYGNAPDGDRGTIETVKAASAIMKQTTSKQDTTVQK